MLIMRRIEVQKQEKKICLIEFEDKFTEFRQKYIEITQKNSSFDP
jgi:hypothetical protein